MNYGPWTIGSLHAPSATIDAAGRYLGIFNSRKVVTARLDESCPAAPLLAGG